MCWKTRRRRKSRFRPPKVVEHGHVGVGVVEVIGVWRIVFLSPVTWQRAVEVENVVLGFGLIVHTVEAHQLGGIQEDATISVLE